MESKSHKFIARVIITLFWSCLIAAILMTTRADFFVNKRSITVFSWGDTFDIGHVRRFEKETGIKVYLSSYTTNEELLVKLRATGGRDYDLVIPSDYAVKKMVAEGLLKKIDKKRLIFFEDLNPLLLGHFFDPENDYSLPIEWSVYVVGVNKERVDLSQQNITSENVWDLIFTRWSPKHKITMVNDAVEVILFAAHYLFGPVDKLSDDQVKQVQKLLSDQKSWVEVYNNERIDYYLGTNNASVGLSQSSSIWRGMREYNSIGFIKPKKTFITIENCAIPEASTKEDLVYEFLNFFYEKDVRLYHCDKFLHCPVLLDVIEEIDVSEKQKKIMKSSPEAFANYSFIRDLVTEQQKHDIWITVKS